MTKPAPNFPEIARVFREHQNFAVLSHVRPDGDALGSQLALALSLKQLGKDVRVWNEDGMLEKYSFLSRAELLTKPPSAPEDVDVGVALDTAIQNRLGSAFAAIRSAKIWVNIDHHPSNPAYGDLVYVDPTSPATGQILFELSNANNCHSIARSLRIFTSRYPLIPAHFNIPTPPPVPSRSRPSLSAPVSM